VFHNVYSGKIDTLCICRGKYIITILLATRKIIGDIDMEEEGASNGVREIRQRLIGNAGQEAHVKMLHLLCEDIKVVLL
jgi:hypothetical protein